MRGEGEREGGGRGRGGEGGGDRTDSPRVERDFVSDGGASALSHCRESLL